MHRTDGTHFLRNAPPEDKLRHLRQGTVPSCLLVAVVLIGVGVVLSVLFKFQFSGFGGDFEGRTP